MNIINVAVLTMQTLLVFFVKLLLNARPLQGLITFRLVYNRFPRECNCNEIKLSSYNHFIYTSGFISVHMFA